MHQASELEDDDEPLAIASLDIKNAFNTISRANTAKHCNPHPLATLFGTDLPALLTGIVTGVNLRPNRLSGFRRRCNSDEKNG